jgi:hypothetical protein
MVDQLGAAKTTFTIFLTYRISFSAAACRSDMTGDLASVTSQMVDQLKAASPMLMLPYPSNPSSPLLLPLAAVTWLVTWQQFPVKWLTSWRLQLPFTSFRASFIFLVFLATACRSDMTGDLASVPSQMVDQLEAALRVKFPAGYTPGLRFMSHLWEPLRAHYRCGIVMLCYIMLCNKCCLHM